MPTATCGHCRFLEIENPPPYLQSEFSEAGGQYSPDGKWLAYFSDESGRNEVYVRSMLATGGKLLVSTSGGLRPIWRHDGKEIFYLGATGELLAAAVKRNESGLEIGVAKPLFQMHPESFLPSYDVTPDGQRILVVSSRAQKLPSPITVVVNWEKGLKAQ